MKIRMFRSLCVPVISVLFGCSHQNNTPSADEYIVDCAASDGGQAFASDESFVKFVEAEAAGRVTNDPCKSPELITPDSSVRLTAAAAPTFRFNPTHATCRLQRALKEGYGCRTRAARPAWISMLKLGTELIEGTAEAHCAAFTGLNYLFRVTRVGEAAAFYTAMLSVTSFSPDPAIWQRLLSGRSGQTVSVTIERAVFVRGDISEGPYVQPQPYTFNVGS